MSLATWEHDKYFEEKQARILCELLKSETGVSVSENQLEFSNNDVDVKLEVKMGYKSDVDSGNDIDDVLDEFELHNNNGSLGESIHDIDWLTGDFESNIVKKKNKNKFFKSKSEEEKSLLPCPHCSKVVKSKKWLAKHLQKTHLNINMSNLPCNDCDTISESLDESFKPLHVC